MLKVRGCGSWLSMVSRNDFLVSAWGENLPFPLPLPDCFHVFIPFHQMWTSRHPMRSL